MVEQKQYDRLKFLEKYLDKNLHVPMGQGRYCNIKIDYLTPSIMIWRGEPRETLRMTIFIVDGWIPISDYHTLMEVNDHVRKMLDGREASSLYHLRGVIEGFIRSKTKYFNYPYVHIDQFRFL